MEDRVARLESRIAYLTDRVESLEARLGVVERGAPAEAASSEATASLADLVGLPATPLQHWLGLIGRTLVILGGAYLLRALTGSRVLPVHVGVAAGLLYGAPWLVLASRAASRGAHLDAFAHALTTALIGYPLVWEATLRFGALTPPQSALLLGAITAAALVLASARRLHELAWVVTFGALGSALGLALGTGSWSAYTLLAIGIGIATLWLGYVRDWTFLRWPSAFVANAMLLVLTGRAAVSGTTRGALAVQGLMLAAYLGSFAIRTLVIGREVIPFEVVQSAGVLAVAFGGAIALIRSTGSNVMPVGLASLALAVAGYVVAFTFAERRRHAANFFFYGLLALLFAMVGIGVCCGPAAAAAAYAATGIVAVGLGRQYGRLTLALHASVYALASAVVSGLLSLATLALATPASVQAGELGGTALFALGALAVVVFRPVTLSSLSWAGVRTVPRLVVVAAFTWTATGTLVFVAQQAVGGGLDPAALATVRTVALAAAALVLSRAARTAHGREAGWLVYPLIGLIGLKLLFADFPNGRPETLFVAMAAYGCALIVAPRFMRRAVPAGAPPVPTQSV